MKKLITTIAIIIFILLTSCGDSENAEIQMLKDEIERLKEQLVISEESTLPEETKAVMSNEKIEETEATTAPPETEIITTPPETESVKGEFDFLDIKMTDKINFPKDTSNRRYSDSVIFEFSITNNGDKDIIGIQGSLDIQDMFGKSFLEIECDFTQQIIKAGESIIYEGMGLELNQFNDEHSKLYTSKFESLKFVYRITQVVYS